MSTELEDQLSALHVILRDLLDRLHQVRVAQVALQHQRSLLADLKKAATEARSATLQ